MRGQEQGAKARASDLILWAVGATARSLGRGWSDEHLISTNSAV